MKSSSGTTTRPLPDHYEISDRIDRACDRFEEFWKEDSPEPIEKFVRDFDEHGSRQLIHELVRLEVWYRTQKGDTPTVREYSSRFPGVPIDRMDFPRTAVDQPDRIQLQHVVGEGAFGEVWRALDLDLNRIVAVKKPRVGVRAGSPDAELFRREAISLALLEHPNIVGVHGLGEFEDQIGILLQFVDGPTLGGWRKAHDPSSAECAALTLQLATALDHAHQRQVIHRDIKPGNILVNEAGIPLLTDFGLARLPGNHSTIGSPGVMMGTPAYMSPEQAQGKSVDERSDIYSLGAVLYFLLTGIAPFDGPGEAVVERVLKVDPQPPRELSPDTSPDLEVICLKCLMKDPSARYQTAAAVAEDLQRFADGERVLVAPPPQPLSFFKRHSVPLTGLLAMAALTVVGCFAAFFSGESTQHVVRVATDPPDAMILIQKLDETTGYIDESWFGTPKPSPLTMKLSPGRYCVKAFRDGSLVGEAIRTVPKVIGNPAAFQSQSHKNHPDGSISWSDIRLYGNTLVDSKIASGEMILIPAASAVTVNSIRNAGGEPRSVDVQSFYVSINEFSVGDNRRMVTKADMERHPDEPYSADFDIAMQRSEKAGGRLLTEIEFEYLCILVYAAFNDDDDRVTKLTSLRDDQKMELTRLKTDLRRMRHLFDGQAEWVQGRPDAFRVWAGLRPICFDGDQVMRGGDPGSPNFHNRVAGPHTERWVQRRVCRYRGCGFRLARSQETTSPQTNTSTSGTSL